MKQTNYTYLVDGSILAIEDLHGLHSVTVNADQVLLELQEVLGSLAGLLIIWRDNEGIWDGLAYQAGRVIIYNLNMFTYPAAKLKLAALSEVNRLLYTFPEERLMLTGTPSLLVRLPAKKSIRLSEEDLASITREREKFQENCYSITRKIEALRLKNQQIILSLQTLMLTNKTRRLQALDLLAKATALHG